VPATTAAAAQPSPSTSQGVRTKKLAAYVLGGVGVAALGVGLALELTAWSANKSLTSPSPGTHFDPAKETTVKVDQAAGITLLAIGGAALATGVALYVYARFEQRRPSPVAFAPSVSADHAGLVILGGF
jgi:hypothetical protein